MLKARNGMWHVALTTAAGKRIRASTGVPVGADKSLAWKEHDRIEARGDQAAVITPAAVHPMRVEFDKAMKHRSEWRTSTSQATIECNYRFTEAHFGAQRCLTTITAGDIEAWKQVMLTADLAPSSINQRLSLLCVLCESAGLPKPTVKRERVRKGRIRILSMTEEQAVLNWFTQSATVTHDKRGLPRTEMQARDAMMVDLVAVLIDTGFRLGEMLRVGPDEVSFERNTVAAWETKGGRPRVIPMTPRVASIMARRLASGARHAFPELSVYAADDCWQRMRSALGMDAEREFVIHALRHTCCSRMVAAGADAFRVQKWMGHANIATTQQYVTLDTNDLLGLAALLTCANPCANSVPIVTYKRPPDDLESPMVGI